MKGMTRYRIRFFSRVPDKMMIISTKTFQIGSIIIFIKIIETQTYLRHTGKNIGIESFSSECKLVDKCEPYDSFLGNV